MHMGLVTMGQNGSRNGRIPWCSGMTLISYFGTFAKSMAGIGAFVASNQDIIDYLRYTMRSQIFAKSLPMPMVVGL